MLVLSPNITVFLNSNNFKIKIYKTLILTLVLYSSETQSLKLKKECRLRVFEKTDSEVNVEWRRLHNEELHSLYRSPNIVRVIQSRILRWAGHVASMEESRRSFKILTGKHTAKILLGRTRLRWEAEQIPKKQISIRENGVDSAQDRNYWSLSESGIEPPGSTELDKGTLTRGRPRHTI